MNYIDDHKQVFGVEPICRVLTEHGMPIAPSTYYEARQPAAVTAGGPRGAVCATEIAGGCTRRNYGVYGARKVWLALHRGGIDVARCTVERLMRELGLSGARRGKKKRTTIADPQASPRRRPGQPPVQPARTEHPLGRRLHLRLDLVWAGSMSRS